MSVLFQANFIVPTGLMALYMWVQDYSTKNGSIWNGWVWMTDVLGKDPPIRTAGYVYNSLLKGCDDSECGDLLGTYLAAQPQTPCTVKFGVNAYQGQVTFSLPSNVSSPLMPRMLQSPPVTQFPSANTQLINSIKNGIIDSGLRLLR